MKSHFLQSQEWEEFQKSTGRKVWRVDDVLVVKMPLAFGKSFLYSAGISTEQYRQAIFAPRKGVTSSTPPLDKNNDSPLKSQKQLAYIVKQENPIFLKLEPMLGDKNLVDELLKLGFRKAKKEIQPQGTIILDIMKNEEELLAGMHEKTRYNIRLAQKKRFKI